MNEDDFAIAWTAPARRALARLPEKVATAAVEFLYGSLAANPHRVGKPLKLGLEGLHSARRGDYRVIYRIDDQHRRGRRPGHRAPLRHLQTPAILKPPERGRTGSYGAVPFRARGVRNQFPATAIPAAVSRALSRLDPLALHGPYRPMRSRLAS